MRLAALDGADKGLGLVHPPVLGAQPGVGPVLADAQVGAVDDQALLAALHLHHRARDRGVGGVRDDRAQAPVLRVDPHTDLDVDEAVQGKDGVGEVVVLRI